MVHTEFRHFIAGQWQSGKLDQSNENPSDLARLVGLSAVGGQAEIDTAVASARAAFPSWAASTPITRHNILRAVGDRLLAELDAYGALLSCEEGKPFVEARGEVQRAAQIFHFFAGEALRLSGECGVGLRPSTHVEVSREPLGVVGLITPWNFPIAIPAWKIAPALAFGNCIVFKPAELVPAMATTLVRILNEVGLPPGVLNLVHGRGSVVGAALLRSKEIDGWSFTGSVATGRLVALAGAKFMKRVQLEMGGKNALVVLADADLDIAVDCAVNGAFFSTGQRCTASSRLIVEDGIHDRFVDRLVSRMQTLKVGHALDPKTDIGPVVDARQMASIEGYIALGQSEGAQLAFGGVRVAADTVGHFLAPTLFTGVDNAMRISREEIFGPVATITRVRDFDEAVTIANDSDFGLTAGICTSSLAHARAFRRQAEVGMVMVNLPTAGVDFNVPFGGRKGSSLGSREQGSAARDFYTVLKTSYEYS